MTIEYQVRTDTGTLKFILPERIALEAIATYHGKWRIASYLSGKVANQYVLAENCVSVIRAPNGEEDIKLYIWVGDKIDLVEK